MPKDVVTTDQIAPPVGPFSAAVRAGGFLFLSGQVGVDPRTDELVDGDAAAQAEQVLTNVEAVLQASGKSLADVVRVGVFLTDMADYAAVNAVYRRRFPEPFPARTAVCVAALPLNAKVEIDLIAH